jgi:hypothetical protein
MPEPSLLIKGNEGQCSLCPQMKFIAGADNETVSLIKQFEAHCRKTHPFRRSSLNQAEANAGQESGEKLAK